MQKQTLTILSSAALADHSRTLACLIEACWWDAGDAPRPRIKLITADVTGDVSVVRGCDAALVLLEEGEPTSETFELLDELEQHHIATLILASCPVTQGPKLGGLHWMPLDVDPERLTATLESLLVRQREVKQLAQEVTLAQRLQGGLTGEMNKMHEELELAASVQREFLPKSLPEAEGFEFGVMYRPCSYVSGDIYGVVPLDEAHIGFFLADATGHGVPAALMTVMIARAMHMTDAVLQQPRLLSPGEAMGRLNEELAARGAGGGRFATAVCGVIDLDAGLVTIASAGHPPGLIVGPDGVRQVEAGGCLLGVFPDETFEEVTEQLTTGERLILYTDGFEHAFPHAGADTHARRLPTMNYLKHFEQLREGRLSEAMGRLEAKVDEQAGSLHQVDDLTILAIGASGDGRTKSTAAGRGTLANA